MWAKAGWPVKAVLAGGWARACALTLGILAVRGAVGQLEEIVLEKQLVAGDALHGLQHVVLQSQVAAGFLLL